MIQFRHIINLHKILTPFFVLALMHQYNNWGIGMFTYLALHGTYCLNWILKDALFADRRWKKECGFVMVLYVPVMLTGYWSSPFILVSSKSDPSFVTISFSISLNILGNVLHYGSDCQKYFTLKGQRRLITEGFFGIVRHPNYLGEILIYIGLCSLSMHWLPFAHLFFVSCTVLVPGMLEVEKSLSRYEEYKAYKTQTAFLIPKLL